MISLPIRDINAKEISKHESKQRKDFNVYSAFAWASLTLDVWYRRLNEKNREASIFIGNEPACVYSWTAIKLLAPTAPINFSKENPFNPKDQMKRWNSEKFSSSSLYKSVFKSFLKEHAITRLELLYCPNERDKEFGHNVPHDSFLRTEVANSLSNSLLITYFDLGVKEAGVVQLRSPQNGEKIGKIGSVKLAQAFSNLPKDFSCLSLRHLASCKFNADELIRIIKSATNVSSLDLSGDLLKKYNQADAIKIMSSIPLAVTHVNLSSVGWAKRGLNESSSIINVIHRGVVKIELRGSQISDEDITQLLKNRVKWWQIKVTENLPSVSAIHSFQSRVPAFSVNSGSASPAFFSAEPSASRVNAGSERSSCYSPPFPARVVDQNAASSSANFGRAMNVSGRPVVTFLDMPPPYSEQDPLRPEAQHSYDQKTAFQP